MGHSNWSAEVTLFSLGSWSQDWELPSLLPPSPPPPSCLISFLSRDVFLLEGSIGSPSWIKWWPVFWLFQHLIGFKELGSRVLGDRVCCVWFEGGWKNHGRVSPSLSLSLCFPAKGRCCDSVLSAGLVLFFFLRKKDVVTLPCWLVAHTLSLSLCVSLSLSVSFLVKGRRCDCPIGWLHFSFLCHPPCFLVFWLISRPRNSAQSFYKLWLRTIFWKGIQQCFQAPKLNSVVFPGPDTLPDFPMGYNWEQFELGIFLDPAAIGHTMSQW